MPMLAEEIKATSAHVWELEDAEWSQRLPEGLEGKQLHHRAEEAVRQRYERAEILAADLVDEEDIDSYSSVPPKRRFFVRTRFVFRGKGKPLPFHLDDE